MNASEKELLDKLIFGTASLTSHPSLRKALTILNEAYSLGIRHFDTAPVYGQGYAEAIIGRFIRDKRDQVLITTKFGLGSPKELRITPSLALPLNYLIKKVKKQTSHFPPTIQQLYSPRIISKDDVAHQLYASLNRLRTNYVDYYLLHEGVPSFLTDEALQFLCNQKKEGVIRYIGVAANRLNTSTLTDEPLNSWDVLQYDSQTGVPLILSSISGHIRHFHHSVMSNLDEAFFEGIAPNERPGYILSECIQRNPFGKVVFTTRNLERLHSNHSNYLKYSSNR